MCAHAKLNYHPDNLIGRVDTTVQRLNWFVQTALFF